MAQNKVFSKTYFRCIALLFLLCSAIPTFGQQVDNWYSADRAINTPSPVGELWRFTPYAPADGTPVNVWYDSVDFDPLFTQNAMEHPNPLNYDQPWENYPNHGFEHPGVPGFLTPTGAIPGIPTLRREVFNFNPAIEFDNSGTGDALYFRSHAREETIVFIVFSATGAGTTAETQSLLFGGDITNHLNTVTNLSLGVSSGNFFSVGRTWDTGTFFQSGSINLLERPTIGTFIRETAVDQETLTARVNGLVDPNINGVVRNDPTADEDLFYYNRIGKHFNDTDPGGIADPSNLSGHIAEVLLMDGIANANHIQRMESYLAIKYGITLNASVALGSINGNDSYDYLAADGTTIWPFDATYLYDIAGIGKDRFSDSGANRLRYNLHQRISKSVNAEARVTISTNSNFATDNLDDSRTPIDARHFTPIEHNYLVWGNDHQPINPLINVDLPLSGVISERISREWKIVETRSMGADPISNVSVRIDLTGSDMLNFDVCGIQLMIDEDGDGDFTTGTITYVTASSLSNPNVFFDNVNFSGTDVFTVAYGDLEPPTASNTQSDVCDVLPPIDPTVITDEADNCGVPSVTYIPGSEVSDNLSNPETVTRDYRVTDDAGNFITVQHTIRIYSTPQIDPVSDVVACDSYDLSGVSITGTALVSPTFYDLPGGPTGGGNVIAANAVLNTDTTVYVWDETGTTPNCSDESSFTVTVNTTPTVDILPDVTVCDSFTLPALTTGAYFTGAGGTGAPLSAGDFITTTQTVFIYEETGTTPNCSDESSFTVTVNTTILTNIQNESCLGNGDGQIQIFADTGAPPFEVSLNSNPPTVFANNFFIIDGLVPGNYSLTITDGNGCTLNEDFEIQMEGPNLNASVIPIYGCGPEFPSNTLDVSLFDPTVAQDVLYALDSTDPNDFVISSNFTDINPGNHFLSILHVNGCIQTIPFEIEDIAPLQLDLANTNINEITATVTGGIPPYTYFLDDGPGTSQNILSTTGGGTHTVQVMDSLGCETQGSITLDSIDIEIPNFFTPNNDGQNDLWGPRNTEGYPEMFTIIYDRYGREIKIMGQLDDGWDGRYEAKAMPSGDYWYIIELQDGSGRKYVGHFTLYR